MAFQHQGHSLSTHHPGCGVSSLELLLPLQGPALLLSQHSRLLESGSQHRLCTWDAILESPAQLSPIG